MPGTVAQPPQKAVFHWPASRVVLVFGGALALLVTAAVLWVGWHGYRSHAADIRGDQELLARVLEDQATRTVETASLGLSALAERLSLRTMTPAQLRTVLREQQAGLPFMRSFALVSAEGQVLGDSLGAQTAGAALDLQRLGPLPSAGRQALGAFVPGRGIADLTQTSSSPPGVGFIPLVQAVRLADGRDGFLVGLLNPDAFANFQTLTLDDARATAVLASYTGSVLACTAKAGTAPGTRASDHPVFREQIAVREQGSYTGRGFNGPDLMVSYRAAQHWPLVVIVEMPERVLWDDWWSATRAVAGVAGATILLLGAMVLIAWESLRRRERMGAVLEQTQAAVARRERELSVTMQSVQELIFRTDADGRITYVNARWEDFSGNPARQALGLSLADVVADTSHADVQRLFAHDTSQGPRSGQVGIRPGPDAPERLFDVTVVPLVRNATVAGFAGSAVDVTDRVTAQRRLRTQLLITQLVLESSPAPLAVCDLRDRCLNVNHAWELFTGVPRAQAIGSTGSLMLSDQEPELHRLLLAQGGPLRRELTVPHADGSRRDVVMDKVLVPGHAGGAAGILTVLTDVSEFRAAERATREARDAAEEALRAKSEFIANISHELRTPLQSILGFSEIGLVRSTGLPKVLPMFEDIHAAGQRMLALVNDLLDVAKLESSVGTFHLERADLRPLVRAVVQELGPQMGQKNLLVELALAPIPLTSKVDPVRFQQVVRNVLANAIRFSPRDGSILIEAGSTAQAEIRVRIADQGPGIPPGELDNIFDAFVQSSSTKNGAGGTGLGLTICRKILEIQGGRIEAQNRPGGGAEFVIHLPARGQQETVPMPL